MGFAFPADLRLRNASDYRGVFSDPLRFGGRYLTVLAKPNPLGRARLGTAVAKKHLKRAVDRNRIKRLIRESFRHQQQQLNGWDLVVLANPRTSKATQVELRLELEKLWLRVQNSSPKPEFNHRDPNG